MLTIRNVAFLALAGLALGACSARSNAPVDAYSDAALIGAKPEGTNAIIVRTYGISSGSITLSEGTLSCFDPHEEDYIPREARQICWAYLPVATSRVTVSAAPLPGSGFGGWTAGPCAGALEPACGVQMDTDRSLALRFTGAATATRDAFTLRADVLGPVDGEIGAAATPSPVGGMSWVCSRFEAEDRVNVRRSCSATVPAGTVVTLTAAPLAGTYFAGWGASCSGTSTCSVTMDGDRAVTAGFQSASPGLVRVNADVADSTASSIVHVVNVASVSGPPARLGEVCRAVDGRNFILGLDALGNVVHLAVYYPAPAGGAAQAPEIVLGADGTATGMFLASLAGIIDDGRAAALVEPWIRAQPEFPLVVQAVRALVGSRGYLDPGAPEAATIAELIRSVATRIAEHVVFQPQAPPDPGVCQLRELIGSCYLPGKGIRVDWAPVPGSCTTVRMTFQNPNPHWTKLVLGSDGSGPPSPDVKYLPPKDWVPDATFSSVATSLWSYVDAVTERSLDPLEFESSTVDVTLAPDATQLTIAAIDRDPYVITLNEIQATTRLFPMVFPFDVAKAVDLTVDLRARWQRYLEDPVAFAEDVSRVVTDNVADAAALWLTTRLFTKVAETGLWVAAFSTGVVKDAVYAPFYAYSMLSDGEAQVSIPADALFGPGCGTVSPPQAGGTVSGAVTGAVASGVAVTLSGARTGLVVTGASGSYGFPDLPPGTYGVTPTLAGYVFEPPTQVVTLTGTETVTVTFVASPRAYAWSTTGSMAVARLYHTATLLPSGSVLVTGGQSYPWWVVTPTSELYDPATGTWSSTGSLATARLRHTATLLQSGRVLVTGGGVATAELYDPATGTWSATGSMASARHNHTATLLGSGKVLVVGGGNDGLASAELYDPATGQWSATGSLSQRRTRHAAVLLASGKVLVAGGYSFPIDLSSVEVYDPDTEQWTRTGALSVTRADATATLLATGQVLVAGGHTRTAEIHDPQLGTWSATGSLSVERTSHTATLLPDGRVLVAGGTPDPRVEIFAPGPGVWTATTSLATPRTSHTATRVGAEVLVTGGISGATGIATASAELTREP